MNFTDHSHRVQFESFDILQDEEVSLSPLLFYSSVSWLMYSSVSELVYFACCLQVRQGLKTFSNWPTYPQVYSSGELIGGLDILKVRMRAMWCASRAHVCGMCHYRSHRDIYSGMHLSV